MAEFIKFITEPRREFALPSVEASSKVLGSFELSEILIVKKWQKSDEVKVVVTVPYVWFAGNILPSEDPTSSSPQLSRARYFVIKDEYGEQLCYHLQDYTVMEKNGAMAKIEISGGDARVHSETMTSAPNTSGEDWNGIRTYLLERLFRRLCNNPAEGMAAWQRLPITSLGDSMPTAEEQSQGFLPLGSIEFMELYTIGSPDPLPIAPALEELYGYLLDYEVAPVNRWGADGTESPWWKWMLRGRVSRRALFSESDGSLIINGTSGTNTQTETMSYASKDYVRARYAGGVNQGRVNLRGPWAGFIADSANPPEGANIDNFLTARARSATLRNERVTFDFTLNFSKVGIKPIIGMSTFARIGDLVYRVNVDELASSYTAERGWLTTAPVFLSQDSVRIASIKDGPYIEFTVNTTNTFSIPTCFATASTFKWTVEVDGVFYGEYQGVSAATSNGIPVNFTVPGSHTIRIYDTSGEYNVGWSRAFGFSSSVSGAGITANRNRLTRVMKDSDWGHLLTAEDTGINFRSHQFYNCALLTSSYPESMNASVKYVRNRAYYSQYYGCRSLENASAESMGNGVITIENDYRRDQYYDTRMFEGAIEDCSPVLNTVGEYFKGNQYSRSTISRSQNEKFNANSVGRWFRYNQFYQCANLVIAGAEAFTSNASFDYYFRRGQYQNCDSLLEAAEEAFMSGSGNEFRTDQYASCDSLTKAAEERFTGVILGGFRVGQYANCISLIAPAVEKKISFEGGGFRVGQYRGCVSISAPAEEVPPTLVGDGTFNVLFRGSQYQNCTGITAAAEEKMESVPLGTRIDLPDFRVSQYEGCTSLVEAADEFIDAPSCWVRNFRKAQYKNCASLVLAPSSDGRHGRYQNVTSAGITTGFRLEQFMGCTSLQNMQEEYDFQMEPDSGNLSSQYEGCVSLENNNPNASELYTVRTVGSGTSSSNRRGFRNRQFFGCSSMEYPLLESTNVLTIYTGISGNPGDSTRASQYENCIALIATSVEQPILIDSNELIIYFGNYRTAQYRGCSLLDSASYTIPKLETASRDEPRRAGTASFRANQFQNTPATNVAGNRVKFIDGVEAIPGVNVPNDIY